MSLAIDKRLHNIIKIDGIESIKIRDFKSIIWKFTEQLVIK